MIFDIVYCCCVADDNIW